MRIFLAIFALLGFGISAYGQAAPALATNNGVQGQSIVYSKVNGFVPIVNAFPVIVGEIYKPGLTGSSFGQVMYSSASNPYTNGTYKIVCTLGASATTAGMLSMSISYADAVTGNNMSFQISQGLIALSTTTPTLINAINIAASNTAPISVTTVLVSGTATYTYDCYTEAENHH